MEKNQRVMGKRAGFTIVELLTVMAVIAILIGLLVPALNLVHDTAKDVQQRAQFHAINVGLELFKSEFGKYPDSDENRITSGGAKNAYSGANKLAEAMVGWDLLGFHPKSEFNADGTDTGITGGTAVYDATDSLNRDARSDHYLEIEKANAFVLGDIYDFTTFGSTLDPDTYVLCDSYAKRRAVSGLKTGMPILYFKADTRYDIQDTLGHGVSGAAGSEPIEFVFDYEDNEEMLLLGSAENTAVKHPIADGTSDELEFDDLLRNDQVTDIRVPYNAKGYILMSAGKDGLYGNSDDIYNFKKEQ